MEDKVTCYTEEKMAPYELPDGRLIPVTLKSYLCWDKPAKPITEKQK